MFRSRLFPGGIHPREGVGGKKVNAGQPVKELAAPSRVTIPLQQHIGAPAVPVVEKGQRVLMGQVIGEAAGRMSARVHASVSGTVADIAPCLLDDGTRVMAVTIVNDHQDEWIDLHPAEHPETLSADELRQIIRDAGIVGMGGAAFPTAVKLDPPQGKTVEMLIINGAECEPYLTADHRLMLEKSADVIDGVRLIMLALDIRQAVIGVENDKPDAVAALSQAAELTDGITVKALPAQYPQGGEKQLIYALTRRKVPAGGLPIDVGCVTCNVGTVYAIQQAVREGKPLIDRIVTAGGLVNNPGNFRVRLGTPASHLLEACGGLRSEANLLISGGAMMGTALSSTEVPLIKGLSGLLALSQAPQTKRESPCIRCGRCMRACPMQLAPATLDALVRRDRFSDAERLSVMHCMECGACSYVCPAGRWLTQSCRMGKTAIRQRRAREQQQNREA